MSIRVRIQMRMQIRIAYISIFGSPCVDVGVADFLTKIPFRSTCRMVYRICFPMYI